MPAAAGHVRADEEKNMCAMRSIVSLRLGGRPDDEAAVHEG